MENWKEFALIIAVLLVIVFGIAVCQMDFADYSFRRIKTAQKENCMKSVKPQHERMGK